MKYEGKKTSGADETVYTFTVGKEEIEVLTKVLQRTYAHTPDIFELIPYRGRLRNLVKVFVEVIKGNTLNEKNTTRTLLTIKKSLK